MKLSKSLLIVVGILFIWANWGLAQEPDFKNPYTVDENTVLLLHFNGDLTNASDSSDDASGTGKILFVGSANENLGQAVWVQNETVADTSQLEVAHADVLNCAGNFTIEGWISAVTYATNTASNWWPRYPVVIAKGGFGSEHTAGTGYWADKPWTIKLDQFNHRLYPLIKHSEVPPDEAQPWGNGWQTFLGASNSIQLLEWYHFVLAGDTLNQSAAYMLHDVDGNLIDINTGIREAPDRINEEPVLIGTEGWIGGYGRINMIFDEVRISNVVRDYQFPPIIGNVLQVYADRIGGNATADEAVQISADVRVLGNSTLSGNPLLHYRLGSAGSFTELAMTQGDSTFIADLPGQESGTFAQYYISAETVNGDRLTFPKEAEDPTDPILNGVGWWIAEDMVLNLSFEGNSAVDSSDYGQEVLLVGDNISYSSDVAPGAGGTTSLNINSTEGLPDTSYLEIAPPSPFINPSLEGYLLDFWFKPTSFDHISRHYVFWKTGLVSVETFAPPEWPYAFKTNVMNVVNWPFDLPLNKWLHIKVGRTIDYDFTEFYDANDSLLYVRTELHNLDAVEGWMEERPHSHAPMTMGRRPRWELDATAHIFLDNVKFYNYPRNAPGALKGSNLINENQAPNQAVDVTVQSSGSAAWFLSEVRYNIGGDWMSIDLTPVSATQFTGQIPGQSAGTMVQYYFRFEDNNGRVAVWPAEANAGDYLEFGFEEPDQQTMDLTFEEGPPGPPVNNTAYGHDFVMVEKPLYTDDAAQGSQAMYFDGDSSYMVVNSPFMSSDDFTLEFYFKADADVATNSFFMIRFGRDQWARGTYRIRSLSGPRIEFRITQVKEDGSYEKQYAKNVNYEVDKWYRFYAEVASADTFFMQIYDVAADSLVGEAGQAITGQIAIEPEQPMGIGGRPDGAALWAGKIDDVSFYNYALSIATSIDESSGSEVVPVAYSLGQNYPNPFNPVTNIEFTLPKNDHVKLIIFDVLGRKVAELIDKDLLPGRYQVQWNGQNSHGKQVSTGVYFYQLDARNGEFFKVKKMLLMR